MISTELHVIAKAMFKHGTINNENANWNKERKVNKSAFLSFGLQQILTSVLFLAQTPTVSPMVNGHSSPTESGMGASLSSTTSSPRPGEDNSTARLLRHLQGRVQQLRAQNDSLRKSSENESLNDSHCSVISTESVRCSWRVECKTLPGGGGVCFNAQWSLTLSVC